MTEESRIEGVATAIVSGNEDPEGLFRVRLRLPWMDGTYETGWARIAVPFGAQAVLPEIGDEVLVAFDHADLRYPYVLARLPNRSRPG